MLQSLMDGLEVLERTKIGILIGNQCIRRWRQAHPEPRVHPSLALSQVINTCCIEENTPHLHLWLNALEHHPFLPIHRVRHRRILLRHFMEMDSSYRWNFFKIPRPLGVALWTNR